MKGGVMDKLKGNHTKFCRCTFEDHQKNGGSWTCYCHIIRAFLRFNRKLSYKKQKEAKNA